MKPKFYLTTAIPYVNGLPHLGHSYEMVATDVIARYKRLAGYDVFFLTGVDENSQNVERKARELGKPTQEFVDEMAASMLKTWQALNISNNDFIRTTEPRHHDASRMFFQRSYDNGDIYAGKYEGYYCNSCEAFYDEEDLKDGKCPVHEATCEWLSESNYFFALSKYQDRLLELIEKNPTFIEPETRRNEMLAFIRRGLKDFSISRSTLKWGIRTPIDAEQVIYVWFDALINYVTGVGFPHDEQAFEKWWPCNLHVVGKDITRFHCIYWPAMLMSAGLPVPKHVFGHGWVTLKGEKMSKSRGIYVDPVKAVEEYGADAIRYFLMREIPFGQDGDFTWDSFVARYNADLANDLGNLLNRTLNLATRNFDGEIPAAGATEAIDNALIDLAVKTRDDYSSFMEVYNLHTAVDAVMSLVRAANKYVADTAPWALAKEGKRERLGTVLHTALEAVRWSAVLLSPVVPEASRKILLQLGLSDALETESLPALTWGGLPAGIPLGKIEPLFPRLEVPKEEREESVGAHGRAPLQTPQNVGAGLQPAPIAETISIDDFAKVDLRLAEVIAAEPVPKSDKLLKLRVKVGDEEREIAAGIAQHYTPEEIVGKRIVIVANLAPRKVFGIESQGMLLAASDETGLCVAEFGKPIAPGSKVR